MHPVAKVVLLAAAVVVVVGGVLALGPSIGPGNAPSPSPTAPPLSIEGTWEVTFTRDAMIGAGLADAAEDNPENYGHFSLFIGTGVWELRQEADPRANGSGTYRIDGSTFHLVSATEPVTFPMPFTLTETTLTFGSGGPVTFRVKPWTRVAGQPS